MNTYILVMNLNKDVNSDFWKYYSPQRRKLLFYKTLSMVNMSAMKSLVSGLPRR